MQKLIRLFKSHGHSDIASVRLRSAVSIYIYVLYFIVQLYEFVLILRE